MKKVKSATIGVFHHDCQTSLSSEKFPGVTLEQVLFLAARSNAGKACQGCQGKQEKHTGEAAESRVQAPSVCAQGLPEEEILSRGDSRIGHMSK